jgi:hypothetical protein
LGLPCDEIAGPDYRRCQILPPADDLYGFSIESVCMRDTSGREHEHPRGVATSPAVPRHGASGEPFGLPVRAALRAQAAAACHASVQACDRLFRLVGARLAEAFMAVARRPEVAQQLVERGYEMQVGDGAAATRRHRAELELVPRRIRAFGIEPQ